MLAAAVMVLLASFGAPDEPGRPADDLIHADLPIFGSAAADKWPQHFTNGDDFGCTSRVAFGTWQYRPREGDDDDVHWYSITNYGVFHCWANVASNSVRADLATSASRPSFFILLEKRRSVELWALQIGARPGSDYLLLSRKPGPGLVEGFNVLQRDCPSSLQRRGNGLDTLMTSYCGINTRRDLVTLVRRMVPLPPLGRLMLVPEAAAGKP